MSINDDLKISTLYDHYKDTITYLRKDLEKRDKIIIYLFLSLIVYFLVEFKEIDSSSVLGNLCKKYLGASLTINYSIITTIILLFILIFTVKYFGLCINIEKTYNYVGVTENNINEIIEVKLITREGQSYLSEYPLLSAFIHRIYTVFLPVFLIVLMLVKLFYTIRYKSDGIGILLTNLLIELCIIMITILYLLFIQKNIFWIKKINDKIKKIFVLLHLYKED